MYSPTLFPSVPYHPPAQTTARLDAAACVRTQALHGQPCVSVPTKGAGYGKCAHAIQITDHL
jgi:hypothetical protein